MCATVCVSYHVWVCVTQARRAITARPVIRNRPFINYPGSRLAAAPGPGAQSPVFPKPLLIEGKIAASV